MSLYRLPNITGQTAEEMVRQMQSYLYQLVEQLNYAQDELSTAVFGTINTVPNADGSTGQTMSEEEAKDTFEAIKGFIIKSADIVYAYSQSITQILSGTYVAKSDYGTYKAETESRITTNSENITAQWNKTEAISKTVNALNDKTITTNAWLKAGNLGGSNWGLEIGQIEEVDNVAGFRKFAQFLPDGISFYLRDTNNPVATFTTERLEIPAAYIRSYAQIGQYEINTKDGIAFKFIGNV